MSATTRLALPEPARTLWLRTRDAVRTSLEELGGAEYEIGGGTVLAARWGHRISHDIDLTLPDTLQLHRLENPVESRFEHRMRELGGRPEYYRSLRMYQVRFGDQGLDLWAHAIQPPGSQERINIEGREESVLSNVQILWGKLARAERNLSRDVYDLVHAAEHDPASLEIAVNAHPRGVAEWAARSWEEGGAAIAFDAGARLQATPAAERTQLDTLGERGARTINAVLYEELTLRTSGHRLQIETATAGGVHRRAEIEAGRIREELIARGLTGDRRRHGPKMEALISYAEALCRDGAAATLIYREDARRATHWQTASTAHNLPAGPPT
ncbi:MAG: nucleotidyl transferase AbiEii/AbiGii toxin family protein [Gemmatimonadaceae bacterium]|nr:nucleotidyl transferase AbiEii/AbiGii toxin family protein [Gemmatimonadaceae bacterium]